ncbi:MAG: adenylate/guanylate cyclase domain-containing protein [Deltaproteobacteria bacterium]|nr:adenylate/guanylate cyclase domain-containing protein [Deltaproteobacteria bacterium]
MEARGATEGERKTITALFADIKNSMALIEDLDPEDARRIVDPALQLMMDAVHRYEGYVSQSTGDGIFAFFGAPIACEDHPQRALYAALRATGAEASRPYSLALLAEAYGKGRQTEEGLTVLAEALATADKTGEPDYEAELYRLKGELSLKSRQVKASPKPVKGRSRTSPKQVRTSPEAGGWSRKRSERGTP